MSKHDSKLPLTQQNFPTAIAPKWYHFELTFQRYMLYTPDSHLSQQIDELKGRGAGLVATGRYVILPWAAATIAC